MKVVINTSIGGSFGLSHKAIMRYAELAGIKLYPFIRDIVKDLYNILYCDEGKGIDKIPINNPEMEPYFEYAIDEDKNNLFLPTKIDRTDPALIQVVEEMGREVNSDGASLKIVEIPDDVDWQIENYNYETEWVAEKRRIWK